MKEIKFEIAGDIALKTSSIANSGNFGWPTKMMSIELGESALKITASHLSILRFHISKKFPLMMLLRFWEVEDERTDLRRIVKSFTISRHS